MSDEAKMQAELAASSLELTNNLTSLFEDVHVHAAVVGWALPGSDEHWNSTSFVSFGCEDCAAVALAYAVYDLGPVAREVFQRTLFGLTSNHEKPKTMLIPSGANTVQ